MKKVFSLLALVTLIAAAPPSEVDPLRAGIEALDAGDLALAEKHFAAAMETSTDPGLVAFNRGVLHFQRKDFAEAERCFTRALDDGEAPPERWTKALYNRGVCLIRKGGLNEYRSAIDSFERCLARPGISGEMERDAKQNLEIAKLLWAEARVNAKEKPKPNEPPEESPPEPEKKKPKPKDPATDPDGEGKNPGTNPEGIDPQTGLPKPGTKPNETSKTVGGKGNLPVRIDPETWRPKDEAEAREYLKTLSQRLGKDRKGLTELMAPPERAHVKDW